jgi:putative transposase
MQKWQQWETASRVDWGLAVEREAVIRPLVEQQSLTLGDVERAVRQLRVSRSLLYTLLRRYRQRPQASSLLPWKRGRDNNVRVLDQNREQLLNACIKDFYLRPERPSLAALVQEVRRRFSEQQLPAPNYRTVRRRVGAMDLRLGMGQRCRHAGHGGRNVWGGNVHVRSLLPYIIQQD